MINSENLDSTVTTEAQVSNYGTIFKMWALQIASYFNEPACKVREYFYSLYTIGEIGLKKAMTVAFLTFSILFNAFLTPLTAPVGIAIRATVASVSSQPFIYQKHALDGKILSQNRILTMVSHNECYVTGGYSITDGQVTPPSRERMDANLRLIQNLNPDLICLYEVSDIVDANYLTSQLPEYPFIIPVAGFPSFGLSSMMYIASKYEIVEDSIEFVPFEKGTELTGRAQLSEKGYLCFDLKSGDSNQPFATVISTHLQHSEIPARPEQDEKLSRAAQMRKIAQKIEQKVTQGRDVIFTGDLNLDEAELNDFLRQHQIDWLKRDSAIEGVPTWGGDQWCAELMGKTASAPLVLDYTFVTGKTASISTQIIDTGYSGEEFRPEATSDHNLLFSTISFEK